MEGDEAAGEGGVEPQRAKKAAPKRKPLNKQDQQPDGDAESDGELVD